MSIHKKLQTFNNINQKINGLNVLQDFMETIGEDASVDDKIQKINDILIERYEIKYSTIVVFNGAEYTIKASNVSPKHWDTLKNLHQDELFKEAIATATPKYVTIERPNEKLSYQKIELGRAKSAMFFPLYIENVYIGYWIIESGEMHAFDGVDTTILEVIKDNIVSVLKTVTYQSTIENIVRTDLFTGLYSAEYLYGTGKQTIDNYTTSTVCMFKIVNIEEINEEFNRKTGNETIIAISNLVKSNISSEYIFVRYMGPKFAIVFSGVESNGVVDFIVDLKKQLEALRIEKVETKAKTTKATKTKKKVEYAVPKLNFVVSTYYRGTALDGITKKLEEFLDEADKTENDINYI